MNNTLKTVLTSLGLIDTFLDYKQKPYIALNKSTAELWAPKIKAYEQGIIPPVVPQALKPELVGKPIIWQYWGQGFEGELPEIIRHCFASVDKYKGDHTIIRLSDETLKEYLTLPDYVWEHLEQGRGYTRTFFSDLLRVALLAAYGGIWFDATIYLTGELPDYIHQGEFFAYQRSDREPQHVRRHFRASYYSYWGWQPEFEVRVLNAFLVSKPQHSLTLDIYTLLLTYWREESEVKDYFFFQVLFNCLMKGKYADKKQEIVSDCLPHLLGLSLCDPTSFVSTEEALRQTSIHKLNSKGEDLPKILDFVRSVQQ